ncbi:ZBT12 protein, partial [Rhinopomastus cyanomelas]|nr:ZBT12 protein [Rhinopomastus cyanomelas]
ELLRFQLPGHEAAALRRMTRLRAEERFCDVTIVARSLRFRGHRVVLAACSPFLRDQFLLNPAAELRVSLAHSARVLADLLLSCYTGALQFAGRDLVNYLTAASYLQMEHVVERCRGALARYLQAPPPAPPSLRPAPPALRPAPPKDEEEEEEEEEEEDDDDEEEDDDDEEEEEEEDAAARRGAEDAVPDVCIVKVGWGGGTGRHWEKWGGDWEGFGRAPPDPTRPPPLGVVKACYSLAPVAHGEGLLIFPGGSPQEPPNFGGSTMGSSGPLMGSSGSSVGSSLGSMGSSVGSSGPSAVTPFASTRCSKCAAAFHGVEKLVFHMRSQHLLFMCPRCSKLFNHSSNLNRHMNVHRGLKSHNCGVCGKSFTQKSTLHDHLNLHSGQRPYRCSYCDVRFAHKPAIRRHLKEQHGKTTAQNVLEA